MPLAEAITRLPPKKNVIQALIFVYSDARDPTNIQLSKEIEVLRRQVGGLTLNRNVGKRDLENLEEKVKKETVSNEDH